MFHTEDNRSTFTKNGKSKGQTSGGPSGGSFPNHIFPSDPNQIKTSSSKNTNQRNRRKSGKDSIDLRVPKRNSNFLDEFDKFE